MKPGAFKLRVDWIQIVQPHRLREDAEVVVLEVHARRVGVGVRPVARVGGLALFTSFSPELGLWVGTFHHVNFAAVITPVDDSRE